MYTTSKALNHYQGLLQLKKSFPGSNPYVFSNFEKLGVDPQDLAHKAPYLYGFFVSAFSGEFKPHFFQTWSNMNQAYQELISLGLLTSTLVEKDIVYGTIENIILKSKGPLLIPLDEIKSVVTEVKTSTNYCVQVDFYAYLDLLEKYYEIDFSDVFQSFSGTLGNIAHLLGLSKEEFDKISFESLPSESLIDAKVQILYDFETMRQESVKAYFDYKHYFVSKWGARNGSLLNIPREVYNKGIKINEKYCLDPLFLDALDRLLFKEMAQHPFFKGIEPSELTFHFHW